MAAEQGHEPNRWYRDQQGNVHLNGASFFDSAENNIAAELNNLNLVTFAVMGGARVLTVPDPGGNANFVLAGQAENANGLFATPLGLTHFKNLDGSSVAAAAGAGVFGYAITLGTSFALIGEASNNNSKTDDALIEYVLPPWYIAGQNLTVTVNASIITAGAPTYATKTVQILAYRTANDGTQGADIGPGAASAITVAGADVAFVITGATLHPGDKVVFKLEAILHDTAGVACHVAINSVRVG